MNALSPSDPLLAYRLRQQSLLAEFGLFALRCHDFAELLQRATEVCADGMHAQFAKVLEHLPAENRLLVRAGVGWGPDVVMKATIGADVESPAGYALRTGAAVISNHLTAESRFRTPKLLEEYGVKRAINVIIRSQEKGEPFGVLEVDSVSGGQFDEADLAFMQGFANLLGVAIERHNAETARTEIEKEFDGAFETSPVGMAWADLSGRFTRVNPALCAMTGYGRDELLGLSFAAIAHPDDREVEVAHFQRLAGGGIRTVETERRYLRKDSSILGEACR